MSNRQYIPPTKPKITPRITKQHLVPNRLSIQMPPRAGTVIAEDGFIYGGAVVQVK
jgi:hypothetical protein